MKKQVPKDAVLIPDTAKRVFRGQIFDVYQWPQKMFDNSTQTFEMLRRPDTIAVIAVVEDKILILDDEKSSTFLRNCHPRDRLSFPTPRSLGVCMSEASKKVCKRLSNF